VIQANGTTKVLAYHRWDQGSGIDDVIVVAKPLRIVATQLHDRLPLRRHLVRAAEFGRERLQ
jgi:hypothetical protein